MVGATQNVGLGAGDLLAGLVVDVNGTGGYRVLILVNALSFVRAAALVRWHTGKLRPTHAGTVPTRQGYCAVLADRPFLGRIACNVVFALCAQVLEIALLVYATEALGAPLWIVDAAFALNTEWVVALQTVVVRLLEPNRRTRILLVAGLVWATTNGLFALCPACLPSWRSIPWGSCCTRRPRRL